MNCWSDCARGRFIHRKRASEGESSGAEVVSSAGTRNVAKVGSGKAERPRGREWIRPSVVDDVIRRSGEIDGSVIRGESGELPARPIINRKSTRLNSSH